MMGKLSNKDKIHIQKLRE